jgi:hypothetical protein
MTTISAAVSPTSAEVVEHITRLRKRHPDLVKVHRLGETREGRPLHAVTVTDPKAPARNKQHVLITAGHHGNEESGRLIALAVMDWLVTPGAAQTRRRQKIVIMPDMSPDMAETDTYVPAKGAAPMRDHGPGGPKTPEGKAFEQVANGLQPEVYVDLHARGFAGCSYDMVLWAEPRTYTEDDYLLHRIAAGMGEAGERAGIPNVVHPLNWPGFMSESPDVSSANAFCYRSFKSLSFLAETCESNEFAYPARDRARSGLARMKALFAWGNRRFPKLRYPGYPCYLMGMFKGGLVAVGKHAAARRKSRVAIWRGGDGFKSVTFGPVPAPPDEARITVEYKGPELRSGVGLQTLVRGQRQIAGVTANGRRLGRSETNGSYTWRHGCATYIVVALAALGAGKHEMVIRLR